MVRIVTPTEDVKVHWPSICPWSNFDFSCSIQKQKPIIVLLFIKNLFIYSFIYNFKTCYQARQKCPLSAVTRLRQELTTSSQPLFLRAETADTNHNTALFLPSESRFLKVPIITGSNKLFNSRSISLQWLQVPLFSLDVR